MIKKPNDPNGNAHRVITFLTRDELDFLDKISKDALFSAGTKLSRSKIISAIVNVMRRLDIDACGLNSKKQLELRIIKTIRNLANNINSQSRGEIRPEKGKGEGKNEGIL